MSRLVFLALLLSASAAVAAPPTGLKNPFAASAGPSAPAGSIPAANIDSDLKNPFLGAGQPTTDLKNPWRRPGELRDPFAADAGHLPPAPAAVVSDGVVDPWTRRAAREQAEPSTPVAENVYGLIDPWARAQRPMAGEQPTSDLKNPFAPARPAR